MGAARWLAACACLAACLTGGCKRFEVTAVPLSQWNRGEPEGIPFYLPKPLLIVTKNVHFVETEKVGLTDTVPIPNQFDDQAKYADVNARTDFQGLAGTEAQQVAAPGSTGSLVAPSGSASVSGQHLLAPKAPSLAPAQLPRDGLVPRTFFTVQIVFVPDLSQKYGLRIRGGGPGEVRAALNLVNGWMFTGLGPFYFKDSSTAQNFLAAGIGANLFGAGMAEVVRSLADLQGVAREGALTAADVERAIRRMEAALGPVDRPRFDLEPGVLEGYAEIYVFEPQLTPEGQVVWQQVCALRFDREYLGYYEPVDGHYGPVDEDEPASGESIEDAGVANAGVRPEAAVVAEALGLPREGWEPLLEAPRLEASPTHELFRRLLGGLPGLNRALPRRVVDRRVRLGPVSFPPRPEPPSAEDTEWQPDVPPPPDEWFEPPRDGGSAGA